MDGREGRESGRWLTTDVDNLHDAKLDVLLQRARRPQINGRKQRSAAFWRDLVAASQLNKRHAFRDEVADPTLDTNGHAIHFGQGAQQFDVDESDVAGSLTCNRNIQLSRKGSCDFC